MADGIELVDPSALHESPENPRQITGDALQRLIYSLERDPAMLDARPLIATKEGEVVCGNHRLRAALAIGMEKIPVYFKEFDSASQKREWMLRDNAPYAQWIPDELATLVADHEQSGGDVALLGFADQELEDLRRLAGSGGADLPEAGDQALDEDHDVWGVVIDLTSEDEQVSLLEELAARGLRVRALLT